MFIFYGIYFIPVLPYLSSHKSLTEVEFRSISALSRQPYPLVWPHYIKIQMESITLAAHAAIHAKSEMPILPSTHSALRILSCTVPSVRPSRSPYNSTAHNIQRILFIFGTAIDLCRSMNPVNYEISMFNVARFSGTLKFYEHTDWLGSLTWPANGSRSLDGIFFFFFGVLCTKYDTAFS